MKQTLYGALQRIVETFQDAVDPTYTSLPVCRFYQVNTVPSLFGDGWHLHKQHIYRIDLFTEKHDSDLELAIENALFNTGLTLRISSIASTTENQNIKTTFEITIEE